MQCHRPPRGAIQRRRLRLVFASLFGLFGLFGLDCGDRAWLAVAASGRGFVLSVLGIGIVVVAVVATRQRVVGETAV